MAEGRRQKAESRRQKAESRCFFCVSLDKRPFIMYIRRAIDAGKFLFSKYSKVIKIKTLALEKSSASLKKHH